MVSSGKAYTSSDLDWTVKVEATGLAAFTRYFYRFSICDSNYKSTVGRTKTAPAPNDMVSKIGLAVYSCSNFPFGFFNAFGNPVRKDSVDYMIHLGDYVYEYAGTGDYGYGYSINRVPAPYGRTIYSLYDYRARFGAYRGDLDLQAAHAAFPWITVWDDHEVSDNTYRDGASELNNTEQSFIQDGGVSVDQRKMNAVRAYFEWMPLRQVEMDDNLRIWRNFQLGSLLDLTMLDTRQYDRSITDLYWNTEYVHLISNNAGRSMMGSRQENWFYKTLGESAARGARWRVIGSQTVFSRTNESIAYGLREPLDYDAWDGYQANRNRTFSYLQNNNIGNNIVIAGDSHANWVSDLTWLQHSSYDPSSGTGALGAEFAGTAVSSPCPFGQNITLLQSTNISDFLVNANTELQWSENYYRGYFELHITYEEVTANYFGMPTIVSRNPYEISLANFTVKSGANRLTRPVAGGVVEHGALKEGSQKLTNLTHNTENNQWLFTHYNQEDL